MDSIDVNEIRTNYLRELREKVNRAFENRKQETLIPELASTKEAINWAERRHNTISSLPDNFFIDAGEYVEEPNFVSVDNSHDYKHLLTLSLIKLAKEGYFFGDIEKEVEGMLEHEFEHHVSGLGHEGLQIRYAIEFIEDKDADFIGYRPAIVLNGNMTLDVYRDIVGSVSKPSAVDSVLTRDSS